MATELASAYVSLGVSTKGMGKDVRRALGDVEGGFDATGKKAGKSLGSGLGKGLKVGVLGIAGITAGVAALAAKGGISRALNIEGAQAKLRGLGHDTKSIQTIMDSALASVKGTAFGLGDAATVAASTVAAGVKPGQDLTRTLKLVADASTIAGTSMTDMGLIFNKVAGTGKIQGEVIAQLGERGIPILQLLADEMGVSAAEVGKLASAGKIGFAEFQNAMEKGMGGAALESGTTFTGAMSNVNAALGRLGAAVATPGLDTLKAIFNDAIPAIDAVTTAVGPLIQNLSGKMGPAIEKASEAFFGWITAMASGESDLSGITALFTPLGQVLKGMAPVLSQMGEQFGALGVQIGTALAPLLPIIVQALTAVLTAVTPLLPVIGGALTTALTAVVTALTPLIPMLGESLMGIVVALGSVLNFVGPIFGILADAIAQVVTAVAPLLPTLISLIEQGLVLLSGVLTTVLAALTPIIPPIADLISQYLPVFGELIGIVLDAVVGLIPVLGYMLYSLAPLLPPLIELGAEILPLVVEILEAVIPVAVELIGAFAGLASAILPVAVSIIKFAIPPLKEIIKWLLKVVAEVVKFVAKWASKMAEFVGKVAEAIPEAIQWFKDLPGKIGAIFFNAGTWLLDAGKKIIGGFVDGIKGAFSKVKDTLSGLTDMLPDWKGPAKRDAKILKPAGKLLMKGLVAGITVGMDDVKKALGNVTDGLAKIAENGVKAEADRLIAARKKANDRIAKYNKALAKKRDKDLAAADKISDSKKKAAEKKRINAEYKRKKKDSLGTLSRADAEKQAKKNLKATSAAVKRAQKLVNAQGRTTKDLWNDGRYKGSVQRWQGLNAGTTTLLSGLTSKGNAKKGASSLVKKATLADVAKAREDVGKALEAAKGVLADMRDARADLAASVASSIKGELDLAAGISEATEDAVQTIQRTNARGDVWYEERVTKGKPASATFKSVAGTVKAAANKARAFAGLLKDLAKKGIPAGLIQEVAGYGTEQGTIVGKALLSGSAAEVKELSADYASLGKWSDAAGDTVAGSMYDVGIQAQQGLVDGLLADDAKLAAAAKKMTERLTTAVKKELGIKSPSRLFRDEVGVMVSRGVIAGMDREQSTLDKRAAALVPTPNVNAGERGNLAPGGRSGLDGVGLVLVVDGKPVRGVIREVLAAEANAMTRGY